MTQTNKKLQIIKDLISTAINQLKKQQYESFNNHMSYLGSYKKSSHFSSTSSLLSNNNQGSEQLINSNSNKFIGFGSSQSSSNSTNQTTNINNQNNNNFSNQNNNLPSSLSYIKRISLNLQQSRTYQILQQLRKGYLVRKHSPNTSQPHDKFVYISEDHRFFCWKSIDKNDQKSLQLRKITNVVKGLQYADSKTMKSLKNTQKQKNCLVVISSARRLEIQALSNDVIQTLYEGFVEMMKNSKRMHLSYQF